LEGWVGPRVGQDAVEKREILHCWESKIKSCLSNIISILDFQSRSLGHPAQQVKKEDINSSSDFGI
jgi:hypothetical protein